MTNQRTIIISNRLPIKITGKREAMQYQSSEGGLATGLNSVYKQKDNIWIGWPGAIVEDAYKQQVRDKLKEQNLLPVFLTQEEINGFYEGFSNETLWPLFHYFPSYATFNPINWNLYRTVNEKYAQVILEHIRPDDTIWIHDYQLMLLPGLIRKAMPNISIGYFQHIPFPSYEIFRSLPWREELLNGLLGADLIGFHTYDDVRHFISSVNRITNISGFTNELNVNNRNITVDSFPIGIDYNRYYQLAQEANTYRGELKIKQVTGDSKVLISIDRLDYSKGITHRLEAYRLLLERHPELHGKIVLLHVVVPSRDNVPKYKEMKEEMDKLISDINGKYSTLGWQPIHHFYRSFPPNILSAMYKTADVALVTPMRDGMNLVSKEYVASKTDETGVLILSEMAGAARELSDAVIVNPNNIWDVAEKIYMALNMPVEEQKRRMYAMQNTVKRFDVFNWVNNFMEKLQEVKEQQKALLTHTISKETQDKIYTTYANATRRLILLDYDGTLVPFHKQVNEAIPDAELIDILTQLTKDPANDVVIISGRDYKTLETWLGELPLDFIAEHGAWYKYNAENEWNTAPDLNTNGLPSIMQMMNMYTKRTPGAFIEEKSYSIAWHYRRVEKDLGNLRAQELISDIKHIVGDMGLQVLQGDKVVEVKSMYINKGKAVKRWLDKDNYDFIIAIGDDHTDEDTFKAMPAEAYTIKVGKNISAATYFLNSYKEVRKLLRDLCLDDNTLKQGNKQFALM